MTGPTSFGALLRGHRHNAGMTLEELSEASGVSVRAISDMELGHSRRPQRRTVASIADALRLATDDHTALIAAARGGGPAAAPGTRDRIGLLEPPRTVWDFTGRPAELTWIAQLTAQGGATIGVVSGPPGAGKTALAVHAAGVLAERGLFPDGRFFLDLRGTDGSPLRPAEALAILLRALGVPERDVPAGEEEAAGRFRALLAERRCLLILDNAADEAQVRPLLPGAGAGMALVTSRRSLSGLEGVHRLALAPLPAREAGEFLVRLLGGARAEAEAKAVEELVALCGGLPLALRIAGNRLASRPGWTVAHLVRRLADTERRLAALTAGDLQVEGPFLLSYQQLSPLAQRTFRRLSLVPGPDAGPELAAVLGQTGLDDAEDSLEELVELGLLQSASDGRYRFHDLIRLFARARLQEAEPEAQRRAARERMVGWLLDAATAAGRWFEPDWGRAPVEPVRHVELGTREQARAWIEAELANWFGAFRLAAEAGEHRRVVDLAESMHWYSDRLMWWPRWLEVYERSAASAHALGDGGLEVTHRNYHAWALNKIGKRPADAIAEGRRALALAEAIGDVRQQAWAWTYIGAAAIDVPDPELMLGAGGEATARFEAVGDWDGYAQALAVTAFGLESTGRLEEALAQHRTRRAALTDPVRGVSPVIADISIAHSTLWIGELEVRLGDWPAAAESLTAAVPLLEALGQSRQEARARLGLARALRALDPSEPWIPHARRALETAVAIDYPQVAAEARRLLS
ncbi:MAG TPA: helix-turn-helix domain-containing protein [Dactylosporangium sp.]|jgi:transcriptional regulator with XRE-family HTH domain/tetratricopeptide (TPR) repeat protein|nr:helix-turn-helix domain-containing protein [Dactylosporangium sp.]